MKDLNHEAIEASTVYMMQRGVYLLQAHRFAGSEMEHANRLLQWADPIHGAKIIDLGSGIGSLAAAWLKMRPDLDFTLVNINKFQLDMSPRDCKAILCDMEHVPLGGEKFDLALTIFSIGHCDARSVIREASRLIKGNGVFFIYDMLPNDEQSEALTSLNYGLHRREDMERWASEAGLQTDFYMEPRDRRILNERIPEIAHVFHDLQPVIYRFIKDDNL